MPTLRVHQIRFHHESLFDLELERGEMAFEPGACVALFNDAADSRPYSIAAGSGEEHLRFLIRRIPNGRVSDWLARRQPGEQVQASAPFGWFRPGRSAAGGRSVFIATGTGIAPFLSYLRSYPDAPPQLCLYGMRQGADAVNLEELQRAKVMRLAVSRESGTGHFKGRVTDLLEQVPLADDIHYYLCGLDAMIDATSAWLEAQGVAYTQIHREIFFYENGPL
jgi:ferredoxin-NADP reductase